MRAFKLILKILLIVVFVLSFFFNLLLWGSSHGTLLVKHDDLKFKSMVSTSLAQTSPSNFLSSSSSGIQIIKNSKQENATTKESIQIYIDKKYNLTYKSKLTTTTNNETETITKYFKDGSLYTENITSKSKKDFTATEVLEASLSEINLLQSILVLDIDTSKEKVKAELSFSPFYFIGFSYKIKDDIKTTTYSYDLSGKIRKISISYKDGKTESYTIDYKNNKVKLPDLSTF